MVTVGTYSVDRPGHVMAARRDQDRHNLAGDYGGTWGREYQQVYDAGGARPVWYRDGLGTESTTP